LDAVHADGTLELDAHSLYGTMEVHNTHNWFKDTQKERTMIISRSSYAGMGKYGSRWLGDNFSTDAYMAYSVTGVMGNNIAGITLAGSDICGFIGNTNADLCARWYTLGAYYPFSRNHNAWNNAPQEPWEFAKDIVPNTSVSILEVIQSAMYRKLHMIRYMYTQMSIIQQEGGSYFRPLFYDFPNELGAYADQELNVMLGPSLKLAILSGTSATTTDFWFPAGTWCDIYCRAGAEAACCVTAPTGGEKQSLGTQ